MTTGLYLVYLLPVIKWHNITAVSHAFNKETASPTPVVESQRLTLGMVIVHVCIQNSKKIDMLFRIGIIYKEQVSMQTGPWNDFSWGKKDMYFFYPTFVLITNHIMNKADKCMLAVTVHCFKIKFDVSNALLHYPCFTGNTTTAMHQNLNLLRYVQGWKCYLSLSRK